MRNLKIITLALVMLSTVCLIGSSGRFIAVFGKVSAQQNIETEKSSQSNVASKTVVFSRVSKTDAIYKNAIDAHALAQAQKLNGEAGAFKGTVSRVFQNRNNNLVVLDFDAQYKSALTAVLKRSEFAKFPDIKTLEGKEVVITGKFIDYKGKTEIVLTEPDQVKLVAP